MTATDGRTARSQGAVVEEREPWWATFSTVASSGAPAATSACSRAVSMSAVSRNDASPYSIRSTIASSLRLLRDEATAGGRALSSTTLASDAGVDASGA